VRRSLTLPFQAVQTAKNRHVLSCPTLPRSFLARPSASIFARNGTFARFRCHGWEPFRDTRARENRNSSELEREAGPTASTSTMTDHAPALGPTTRAGRRGRCGGAARIRRTPPHPHAPKSQPPRSGGVKSNSHAHTRRRFCQTHFEKSDVLLVIRDEAIEATGRGERVCGADAGGDGDL
jgi:hypothetical protein